MKYDLVSVGETMVCFLPDSVNPLRYVNGFQKTIAGAESNVCIGLSKLNKKTCWISSLGKDEFGSYIRNQIRSEGVDVSANISETSSTGIMFKQFTSHRDNAVFTTAGIRLHPASPWRTCPLTASKTQGFCI